MSPTHGRLQRGHGGEYPVALLPPMNLYNMSIKMSLHFTFVLAINVQAVVPRHVYVMNPGHVGLEVAGLNANVVADLAWEVIGC